MKKLVIFASGSGSNAENIHDFFKNKDVKIVAIFTNNKEAFVIERAKKLSIPCFVFDRDEYKNGTLLEKVNPYNPDLIVLAGFLWLIPSSFVKAYPNRIINIHPALLPNYGGKGMYGNNVHKAIIEAKEKESGISIHFVNEHYDEGDIIFQTKCVIDQNDTSDDLASKIHALEYLHFPKVIEKVLKG